MSPITGRCPACGLEDRRYYIQRLDDLVKADAEITRLNLALDEMAKELHAAINEPMYAGTRKDWIDRAYAAEAQAERMKDRLELLEEFYKDNANV